MNVQNLMLIAGGGAAGAVARYGANLLCIACLGKEFPWGTLVVNVLGCFALGWLVHFAAYADVHSWLLALFGTGFLGSFTTYSSFGLETIHAWYRSPLLAALNVGGNLVLGLLSVLLGIYLATRMNKYWLG